MSWFNDQLADDAPQFDDLGSESITYTPPAGGGSPRTILALVNRNPPAQRIEAGELIQSKCEIDVRNHATLGVSATAAIRGGKFSVPLRLGHSSTVDFLIVDASLINQDGGRLLFSF